MLKKFVSKTWLPHIGLIYLLPAFLWWAVLLWQKNEKVFLLQHGVVELNAHHFTKEEVAQQHAKIQSQFDRQRRMILAEGAVFLLLLGWGLHRIRSSFKREVELAKQQRNFQLSVTHELKSPIAAVQLGLETLLKREFPPEKVQKIMGNALKDTKRLNKLVEDILLSASLEDIWRPNKEAVDLRGFIANVVENINRIYPNALIQIEVADDLPLLEMDAAAFASVLGNLLENAIKYADDDGPFCKVVCEKLPNEKIEIRVEDKGIGIADNEKKRIFDKFYRVGSEDTRNAKGTGLGLYIVKKVVEAHKGTVSVVDNKPKGTIFKIIF